MPYVQINSFKYGLDTRRDDLVSQPGTLAVAENGHINQGGEFEKRKAFVLLGGGFVPTGVGYCFGLEVTSAGLVTFGSAESGTVGVILGGAVTYQRLQHPDGATAMTAVVSSTSFAGLAFVVATFADGKTYVYYNGTLVPDVTSGLILAYQNTNTKVATAFAALVNQLAPVFTATDHLNGTVDVFDQFGSSYNEAQTVTSAAGVLTASLFNTGIPAISAVKAVGSFTVIAGSATPGTNKITKVEVNAVDILNASIDWVTSNEATAAAIATRINAYTSAPDYTAVADGATVRIFTTVVDPSTANGFVVKTTAAGNFCIGDCLIGFTGTSSANIINALYADGVDISGGGIAFVTNLPTSISAIATFIRTDAGGFGYLAYASGNVLRIAKKVTSSADAPVTITVTPGAGIGISTGTATDLTVTLTVSIVAGSISHSSGQHGVINLNPVTSSQTAVNVTGGVGPYTYLWREYTAGSGNGIAPVSPSNYATVFSGIPLNLNGGRFPIPFTGYFVCEVTDLTGVKTISQVLTVTLTEL